MADQHLNMWYLCYSTPTNQLPCLATSPASALLPQSCARLCDKQSAQTNWSHLWENSISTGWESAVSSALSACSVLCYRRFGRVDFWFRDVLVSSAMQSSANPEKGSEKWPNFHHLYHFQYPTCSRQCGNNTRRTLERDEGNGEKDRKEELDDMMWRHSVIFFFKKRALTSQDYVLWASSTIQFNPVCFF